MHKEWWCEQYEDVCFGMFGKQSWELTLMEKCLLDSLANNLIADRWAALADRAKDEHQ